mgnify:CR=1 FL=1
MASQVVGHGAVNLFPLRPLRLHWQGQEQGTKEEEEEKEKVGCLALGMTWVCFRSTIPY